MNGLLKKRIFAFLIDYLVIIIYAVLLMGISLLAQRISNTELSSLSPVKAQLLAFVTLTLPVFLYFFLSEKSKRNATIGKRMNRIQVVSSTGEPAAVNQVFMRNLIKFLPWEMAHTGVHWIIYYSRNQADPPIWVFVLLILPQVMVIIYIVSTIVSKGVSSLYDKAAKLKIAKAV